MSVGFSIAAKIRAASRSFSHVLRMLIIGTPEGEQTFELHHSLEEPNIYMINVCSVPYYALQKL